MLWLIDEVFKGTNNRERLIGGRALITALAGGNGFGLVTTHDLELSELERRLPTVTNVHFQETVAQGALHFDYRLKPAPARRRMPSALWLSKDCRWRAPIRPS